MLHANHQTTVCTSAATSRQKAGNWASSDATGHLTGIVSIDDIVLRALDQPNVEPDVNFSDTFVSG